MRAGQLRHSFELQQSADVADGAGGGARTWTTFATDWGNLQAKAGLEAFEGMRLEAQVTHILTMRWRGDVTTAHRVLWRGRAMQIRAVLNIEERDRMLELHLQEGVAS